jgi:hypothetical protein
MVSDTTYASDGETMRENVIFLVGQYMLTALLHCLHSYIMNWDESVKSSMNYTSCRFPICNYLQCCLASSLPKFFSFCLHRIALVSITLNIILSTIVTFHWMMALNSRSHPHHLWMQKITSIGLLNRIDLIVFMQFNLALQMTERIAWYDGYRLQTWDMKHMISWKKNSNALLLSCLGYIRSRHTRRSMFFAFRLSFTVINVWDFHIHCCRSQKRKNKKGIPQRKHKKFPDLMWIVCTARGLITSNNMRNIIFEPSIVQIDSLHCNLSVYSTLYCFQSKSP